MSSAVPREAKQAEVKTGPKPLGKSHKSVLRNRPKHSSKLCTQPKKGGAGSKTVWGKPGDEIKYTSDTGAIDRRDPNYVPDEEEEVAVEYDELMFQPEREEQQRFASSVDDLNKFKKAVRTAADEYFSANDLIEFSQVVKELALPIYHQEIPAIVIKLSFDKNETERQRVTPLLLHLFQKNVISQNQMSAGFTKLFNALPDLILDAPNARTLAKKYIEEAVKAGFVPEQVAKRLMDADVAFSDVKTSTAVKAKIDTIVSDYFSVQNQDESVAALTELKTPHFHFEFVKKLISKALDNDNKLRELASQLLSRMAGDVISTDEVCKGFAILLQRVEDLYLDVPDVLKLLSCFLARAVADEALPPAFLLRQDLDCNDMGYRVLKQTQKLLEGKGAALRLANVWIAEFEDEEEEEEEAAAAEEKPKEEKKDSKEEKKAVAKPASKPTETKKEEKKQ